jgi:hypothetical protein
MLSEIVWNWVFENFKEIICNHCKRNPSKWTVVGNSKLFIRVRVDPSLHAKNMRSLIFMFAPCISSIKNTFIFRTDAPYKRISACFAGVGFTSRLHNRLICRLNIDYVYTDGYSKTILCSFSEAHDCSLMMVPAWTETCRSKYYNLYIVLTFYNFYNSVHQLEQYKVFLMRSLYRLAYVEMRFILRL